MTKALPQALWEQLSPKLRKEVLAPCWQEGRFTPTGEIDCRDDCKAKFLHRHCGAEFICEIMACYLLMPRDRFLPLANKSTLYLARAFNVPPFAVELRKELIGLEEHYDFD